MIWAQESKGDHLNRSQAKLGLDFGLKFDGKLLVSELCSQIRVDVLKDFSDQSFWIELKAKGANVFDQVLFDKVTCLDEWVLSITPLPKLLQFDELVQNELVFIQ